MFLSTSTGATLNGSAARVDDVHARLLVGNGRIVQVGGREETKPKVHDEPVEGQGRRGDAYRHGEVLVQNV